MAANRLLFFPDYEADPIWRVEGGMVSLDDLPVSDEARAEARRWRRRWEQLAFADQAAEAYADGMSSHPAAPVPLAQWELHERDGRAVWQRLRAELGEQWLLGWVEGAEVEWSPGAAREPCP